MHLHKYEYRGRTHQLMMYRKKEEPFGATVLIKSGLHYDIDYGNEDLRKAVKRVDKNMRSFIYSRLNQMGYSNREFIFDMKVPETTHKCVHRSFINIDIMLPNMFDELFQMNDSFGKEIWDSLLVELKRLKENDR